VGEDGVGVLKERDHDEPAAWGQQWAGRRLQAEPKQSQRKGWPELEPQGVAELTG
jgi:hypothetical protein